MAINFQNTPAKAPNQLPQPGYYYGKIIEAVMRQPKDVTKSEYLNVTYELYDEKKNVQGRVYDIISNSEKPFMQYKLQRFGQALNLTGKTLELKDLPKLIVNKVIIFSIKIEQNEQYGDRAVIDIGDEGIYYPKSEAANFFEPVIAQATNTAPTPITPAETNEQSAPSVAVDDDEDDSF